MILQSHESFDTLADFDAASGALSTYSKATRAAHDPRTVCGAFGQIGPDLVVLYRSGGTLFLQRKAERHPLDALSVELQATGQGRTFKVRKAPP